LQKEKAMLQTEDQILEIIWLMIPLQKVVLSNAKMQSGEDAKFLREFPCENLWKRLML
jgi:hypothetical protein